MLVKVNDSYKGVFGHYIEKFHSVEAKRAGDPPFEVPDNIAREQIRNSVLVAVGEYEAPEPVAENETVKEVKSAAFDPEELTFKELQAAAKERGISAFRKSRAELELLIREYEASKGESAPILDAEDPI